MLILERPWTRQPPAGSIALNINHPLSRVLDVAVYGSTLWTGNKAIHPGFNSAALGATTLGVGYTFGGGGAEVVRFNTSSTYAASEAISIEMLVVGSSYPSLASLTSWTPSSNDDGDVDADADVDNGKIRGCLAFGGSNPCNIHAWGGAQDLASGIAFEVNKPQHIVLTRAPGTGAVLWSVYKNGVWVAANVSSNTFPWGTSGPYLYLGGHHNEGIATITGSIPLSRTFRKELTASDVALLYGDLYGLVRPRRLYIPTAAAATLPILSASTYVPGSLTSTGWRPQITAS